MGTQNTNPFILPGLGQTGSASENPLLTSMEMMRQAWEGLAKASGFEPTLAAPGLSPDDLERRIADLRTVEHWLQMNLAMLASAIQALEVQRSTVSTLSAFFSTAAGASGQSPFASPLDAAFGARSDQAETTGASASGDSSGLFGAPPAGQPSASASASEATEAVNQATERAQATMQGWWDMLQAQFDSLADATASSLKGADSIQQAAAAAQQQVMDSVQSTMAGAVAPASQAPAAKKVAAKKQAAKKASAKKAVKKATKKAAKKAAARAPAKAVRKAGAKKSTAARKTSAS